MRVEAAKLALQVTQKLLPQFARQAAVQEIGQVVAAAIEDKKDEPRITVTVPPAHLDALKARIEAAERRATKLELEVETLTTLLRKEQASRLAAERRATGQPAAPRAKSRKPVRKSPRTGAARKRTVKTKRQVLSWTGRNR